MNKSTGNVHRVTILQWNMCVANTDVPGAIDFLFATHWHICCLQEVTPEALRLLEVKAGQEIQPMRILHELESYREEECFSVIIVRTDEVYDSKRLAYPASSPLSLRTRLFIWAANTAGQWDGTPIDKGCMYADISIDGESFRVFSVHLTLMDPKDRKYEFKVITDNLRRDCNNIVCGDFNTLETRRGALINYALGGKKIRGRRLEREYMEEEFARNDLVNPLSRQVTSSSLKSGNNQLDHVLVPRKFMTSSKTWKFDKGLVHGSDHSPALVEIWPIFWSP